MRAKHRGVTLFPMNNLSDRPGAPAPGERGGAVPYVLRDLRDAIASGVVPPGDRLPSEHALAARYGVSRTVVREVLRILETQGLTTTLTGKGTFVATPPASPPLLFGAYTVSSLMEARPHIEVAAAGLAAVRRSETQLQLMQELHEEMVAEPDPIRWAELDGALHAAIAAASGNPVFADILERISGALAGQSAALNLTTGRRARSESEHRAVISGIARASVVEAEDSMQYHLDQVKEVLTDITALDTSRR